MPEEDISKLNCLIVDDDQSFRSLLESMLRKLGIEEVTAAKSGSEALQVLKGLPRTFDIVLCDITMAGGNGFQLLRSIRNGEISGLSPNTCFVMVTGSATTPLVKAATTLDVNGYLAKPFSINSLRAAITRARAKKIIAEPTRYASITSEDISQLVP